MRVHVVVRKREEEIWSFLRIIKMMWISQENFFESILQNLYYVVVRANNVVCDFSVAYFPLIKLNGLVTVTSILSNVDVTKLPMNNKDDFIIGFAHIRVFIYSYYDCLAIIDIELTIAINKSSKVT